MNNLDTLNGLLSNISVSIKLNLFCRHDSSWVEHKTKAYYTLWLLNKGSLVIELNNKALHANAGDVVFFYPGDTYKAYSHTDCHFLVFFFTIEAGNSIDLFKNMNLAGIYKGTALKKCCHSFCSDYIKSYGNTTTTSLKLYGDFLSFFYDIFPLSEYFDGFYASTPDKQPPAISSVITYMQEHYNESITMKQLASIAGMSEKYFINNFHFQTGISPKQYIIELRMKRAIDLLVNTSASITDIAMELGYADQYCFSKAFKKYYGEAPTSFKRSFS